MATETCLDKVRVKLIVWTLHRTQYEPRFLPSEVLIVKLSRGYHSNADGNKSQTDGNLMRYRSAIREGQVKVLVSKVKVTCRHPMGWTALVLYQIR